VVDNIEHVTDLIPTYALGSLDLDEVGQIEEHLSACEVCHAELVRFNSIVDDFPLAIQEHTLPNHLKTTILQQAAKVTKLQETRRTTSLRESRSRTAWGMPAWGALGLVVLVLLAVSNLFLWQQVRVFENAATSALRTVRMNGTDFSPEATGMIVMSLDGEYGTLVVDHLPPLEAERQYQLWLVRDGMRTSGGIFSVSQEGYASLIVSSPDPLDSYQAFGITIEPYGGSPGPTGERVLAGQL
jgi:anti-sigma-K factor RskA